MGWDKVKEVIGSAAPLVGGLLGGPAAVVGTLIANALGVEDSPDAVLKELKNNPDALVKIKQMESDERVELRRLAVEAESHRLAAETAQVQAVNATMQAEARSEHWPQWSWRPYNGFLYGTTVFCVYFMLPLLDKEAPEIPLEMWVGWGAVLGVTAWHRGVRQRTQAGDKSIGAAVADAVAAKVRK